MLNAWRSIPEIPLRLAGGGPLEEWVRETTKDMPNVEYLGFFPHKKIAELLNETYAVILPSIWYETFGLVVLEAYSARVPVIATNVGALAAIVNHGQTGLLFGRKNPRDLAEKILWLWNHPKERDRMGRSGRKEFEKKYTAERNYQILMEIYNRTIERHKMQ